MEIFPTDGKVGARFKGDGKKGQQVVWVEDTQAREENGTGQVHEMNEVAHQQEVGWGVGGWGADEERLWPCTHRTGIDDRLYPANNPVQDLRWRGRTNP